MKRSGRNDLIFVCLAMLTVGVVMAETGASLDLMRGALSLSGAQQGNLVAARFVGGILLGIALWVQPAAIRLRRWFVVAMVLIVLTTPLLFIPSYGAAMLAAVVRGLAAGIIIPASGMYAAAQRQWRPGVVAGVVNASLSSGLVLVSLVAMILNRSGMGRWELYWSLGPVLAIPALIVAMGARMEPDGHADSAESDGISLRWLFSRTNWTIAVAGLLVVGSESVMFGLIPSVSTGRAPILGAEGYALILMTGILIGRLSGAVLFRYLRAVYVFAGSAIAIAVVGGIWAVGVAVPLAVFGWGLATSSLFPGLVGVASEALPTRAGTTVAAIGWMGGIGGTVVPAIAGRTIGLSPAGALFVVIPAILAMVLGILVRREAIVADSSAEAG